MLETLSGLVMLFNVGLQLVVAVRLLRASAQRGAPERWLAAYFLLYACTASFLSSALYLGWTDPSLALPARVEQWLNAVYQLVASAGALSLAIFTQRSFRPTSSFARASVAGAAAAMLAGGAAYGLVDDFRVHVAMTPAYWFAWTARIWIFVWLAIEALSYWSLLRRRLALGLADPLVTNRFLLIGAWSVAVFLLGLSDPIARAWYVSAAGATVWVPEVGRPMTVGIIAFTSVVGVPAGATLFLAFFPTRRFQRWIVARAKGGSAGTV